MKRRQPHHRIFNIIEGAVYNVRDAHPSWPFDARLAKSIAKRAAGTLTAAWPEVLAAPVPSDQPAGSAREPPGGTAVAGMPYRGRESSYPVRALTRLHVALGVEAAKARLAGQNERLAALVDALRLVRAAVKEARGDVRPR